MIKVFEDRLAEIIKAKWRSFLKLRHFILNVCKKNAALSQQRFHILNLNFLFHKPFNLFSSQFRICSRITRHQSTDRTGKIKGGIRIFV